MQSTKNSRMSWAIASVAVAGLVVSLTTGSAVAHEHEKEINPKIHRAIEALYEAHDEIDHARHGYHGKKREALDVIDHALDRLKEIKEMGE